MRRSRNVVVPIVHSVRVMNLLLYMHIATCNEHGRILK